MLAFVAGALALSACTSEDILDNGENVSYGNMTFTATFSNDEDVVTRTSVDGKNILWSEGDAISVFSDADFRTNSKMTLTSGAGKTTASFNGTCVKGSSYYAIFPYNKNSEYYNTEDPTNGAYMIMWDGREQTVAEGSCDPNVPMLAQVIGVSEEATSIALNFQNIYSYVKVTTDYKCKSITLTSKNTETKEILSAVDAFVELNGQGYPYIKNCDPDDRYNYVTLKGKDDAVLEAGTYYIAVFPGTLSKGFDLTFTGVNGTATYTKSAAKEVTLKRGTVLNLGYIYLRGTDVETLEGDGSAENPYKIGDMEDLITFQRWITLEKGDSWKKSYLQTADINAEGRKIAPIGTADHRFWGTYDGGNHYIKNLCIEGGIDFKVGVGDTRRVSALFGAIKDATICNLTVWNPSFSFGENNSSNFCNASPLVGVTYSADNTYTNNRCKILNCTLKGTCNIDFPSSSDWSMSCFGGFVAESMSNLEITDCTSEMNLTISTPRPAYVGGFIGYALGVNEDNSVLLERDADIRINRCRNNGQTMTFVEKSDISHINIGGFIGGAYDPVEDDAVACIIYNSVNNASIEVRKTGTSGYLYVGGFMAYNNSDGYGTDHTPVVSNCVNNGNLTSSLPSANTVSIFMGGINGANYSDDTYFTNCANTGTLTCGEGNNPGAISNLNGTFHDCWNCTGNYSICPTNAGDMTNCGQKDLSKIVEYMNNTDIIKNTDALCNWKYSAIKDGTVLVLDLDF